MNPLAVGAGVEDDGAGSLNPPALGIETGGLGIAVGGLLASTFLCGGSILEVSSSKTVTSRFFVSACTPLTDDTLFSAFFAISSKYLLYSALRLSSAAPKLMNGSSRIFTDKARTADSFNPRNDVKYSTSFSSAFGVDAGLAVSLDAAGEVEPLTAFGVSAVFDGSTGVDLAPNAEAGVASDEVPNDPNAVVLGTGAGVDITVEAGVADFAGAAGVPKLNPEKGVLLALALDVSLVTGFAGALAVLPNREAGGAVLVFDVDAGVEVATPLPKLKPEKGLSAGGVLVVDVDLAGAPKAKGVVDAGTADELAGAAAAEPKEKPDDADAPKAGAGADAFACPNANDGVEVGATPYSEALSAYVLGNTD